jgi:hypothetical protein
MTMEVWCPPILPPMSSTECTVVIHPNQDVIHSGTVYVTVRGPGVSVTATSLPSSSRQERSADGSSAVVVVHSLPAKPLVEATSVGFTFTSTSQVCGLAQVDVEIHAAITSNDMATTELAQKTSRHTEVEVQVAPLVRTTPTIRCIRDKLYCVQVEIVGNDRVSVEIDPKRYEWWVLDPTENFHSKPSRAAADGANNLLNDPLCHPWLKVSIHSCPFVSFVMAPEINPCVGCRESQCTSETIDAQAIGNLLRGLSCGIHRRVSTT